MKIKRIIFLRIPPFFGYILHHPHDITLPFTLAYMASAIQQKGYSVKVLDLWANGESMQYALDQITAYDPQLIFYDASTGVVPTLTKLQNQLEKYFKLQNKSFHSIVFGSVATYFPDVLFNNDKNHFDFGLIGECEQTAIDLVNRLDNRIDTHRGKKNQTISQDNVIQNNVIQENVIQDKVIEEKFSQIAGLVFWEQKQNKLIQTIERPYLRNLDDLPSIDYSLFNLKDYRKYSFPIPLFSSVRWGHVLATRGCPYKCSFCSHDHRQSYGRQVRRYSAARLADEFEILVNQYHINAISIEDDIFTVNKDYVFDFCNELDMRKVKVKWVVQTRADVLDRTLMKRMKHSGCVGFSLGIESGNDRVLTILNKEITRKQIDATIKTAGELGLMLRLMFMMGNPTETEAEIQDTINLAMKAKAITVQMHYCTPYPGTDFFDPSKDSLNSLANYSSYNSIYRNMSMVSDQRLNELRNSFYHSYYFSWSYIKLFVRQRLIYMFAQARDELPFILKSLWFLIKKPQNNQTRVEALK